MRNHTTIAALVLSCAALASPARPGDLDFESVTWHGFISQSFLQTSDNTYLALKSEAGTFAYTEEALNVMATPIPKLRVGVQLVGRDLGPQGNHKVTADWALADYRFRDEIGIRAGKIKLPIGLYKAVFDADMARPEALQPDSISPQSQRDFRNTFEGGELYGTLPLGGAGYLDYNGWVGTIDLDEAFVVPQYMKDTAVALLPAFGAFGLQNTTYQLDE